MEGQNIIKIQSFFNNNIRVKQLLNELIPVETDFYSTNDMFKYIDRVSNALEEIEWRLQKMLTEYINNKTVLTEFNKTINTINKYIKSDKFYNIVKQGPDKVLNFIHTYITDMREDFVESVNNGFIGYYVGYGKGVINPLTINEYLHYVHQYVVNNDNIYNSIPIVNTTVKEGDWMGISLRGISTEIGNKLYDSIKQSNIDSACIDIINLKNKIILMARDLGHASVIEIDTTNPNKYFVEYFIPKNTSLEKSGKLKGININKEAFATGSFESTDLANDLCTLMKGIPTDMDIKWDFDINPGHSL